MTPVEMPKPPRETERFLFSFDIVVSEMRQSYRMGS